MVSFYELQILALDIQLREAYFIYLRPLPIALVPIQAQSILKTDLFRAYLRGPTDFDLNTISAASSHGFGNDPVRSTCSLTSSY